MSNERPTVERRTLLLERMLFFSDAVFAIVLTLMALDLHLPPGADDAHLLAAIGVIHDFVVAFALSFALVGVFWLSHLATMRALDRFDWPTASLNLVFLFFIAITPFTTALVAHYGNMGAAWRLYCGSIIAISVAQSGLILVSHRDELQIIHPDHHGRMWIRISRTASAGAAFIVGLALSFAGFKTLSSFCWIMIPILILLARRLFPDTAAQARPISEAPAPESA